MTHGNYIRRETLVSMAINGALSFLFFVLVFGGLDTIPMWGAGNWVFDFLPQGFAVTLMSTLVPGILTARRLDSGALARSAEQSRLPRQLLVRAMLLAVLAALIGSGLIAGIVWLCGLVVISWTEAMALKVLYGVVLGAIVTPIGLRAALAER